MLLLRYWNASGSNFVIGMHGGGASSILSSSLFASS